MQMSGVGQAELLFQFLPTTGQGSFAESKAAIGTAAEAHRILILESNSSLAKLLANGLSSESGGVEVTTTVGAALERLGSSVRQLIIVDLDLPDADGLTLLQSIRAKRPDVRILALSGKTAVEDVVAALDCGADDYLFKPFSLLELTARVRALRRRLPSSGPSRADGNKLTLNRDQCRVERDGRQIDLTPREFALLDVMVQNAGKTLSRSMLTREVWNMPEEANTNIVDVYIKYLRDKIDGAHDDKLIRTVRGMGYILQVQ